MFNMEEAHVILPAHIVEYDVELQQAKVQVSVEHLHDNVTGNDKAVLYPVLEEIPVYVASGGRYAMTFPIAEGDSCLMVFSQVGYDHWLLDDKKTAGYANGVPEPHLKRHFALEDGFCFVGFMTEPTVFPKVSDSNAQLRDAENHTGFEVSQSQHSKIYRGNDYIDVTNGGLLGQSGIHSYSDSVITSEAQNRITSEVGSTFITIERDQISITAPKININADVNITGNITSQGQLAHVGTTSVTGEFSVDGLTGITGNLGVSGGITASGNISENSSGDSTTGTVSDPADATVDVQVEAVNDDGIADPILPTMEHTDDFGDHDLDGIQNVGDKDWPFQQDNLVAKLSERTNDDDNDGTINFYDPDWAYFGAITEAPKDDFTGDWDNDETSNADDYDWEFYDHAKERFLDDDNDGRLNFHDADWPFANLYSRPDDQE